MRIRYNKNTADESSVVGDGRSVVAVSFRKEETQWKIFLFSFFFFFLILSLESLKRSSIVKREKARKKEETEARNISPD